MNSSKKFIAVFSFTLGFGILTVALIIFLIDPFFHYHMPWFGMKPVVNNEIYQNPGLAAHASYDSIIIGSSMCENFDTKWFDEAYGIQTLKLTYSGATAENLRISVENAQHALGNQVKYIFGCLDITIFEQNPEETRSPLPQYLYDETYYNDVYYLLNKDVLFQEVKNAWEINKNHEVKPINEAFMWAEACKSDFSKENVLKEIEVSDQTIPVKQRNEEVPDTTMKVIKKIKRFIMDYPNTQFHFFYSPYSIAYWYDAYQRGEFLLDMNMLEYSMNSLLDCENVKLYFPSSYEMITDLDSYKDVAHYDMEIQYQIFEEMKDNKNVLTKDNYQDYIKEFRKMILECDFEKIFAME